jgi:PKD repeat protein
LKASKTVGFDPLIVEFDASVTKLNDPSDEVVYFTWDFGDGEIRKNTSV